MAAASEELQIQVFIEEFNSDPRVQRSYVCSTLSADPQGFPSLRCLVFFAQAAGDASLGIDELLPFCTARNIVLDVVSPLDVAPGTGVLPRVYHE